MRRREFIQAGFAGAALLAVAGFLDRAHASHIPSHRFLDARGVRTVAALVPVVLAGALPTDEAARAGAIREVVAGFDRAVSQLSIPVQQEMGELFSFLHTAPLRIAFAGLWSPVEESTPDELRAFLARWRASRFDLQRASYRALTQLIQASWYGNPASWPGIGYAGPPVLDTPR